MTGWLVKPVSSCSAQPGRLRHLQGAFTLAGETQRYGVDADVGLPLLGSQKAELMLSAVRYGSDGAFVAVQSAC